jgi:two-component system NtrC family response regulator
MAKILLIDDDLEFGEAVQEALRALGHEVHCLGSAEDGLRRLAAEPFELVLLDNLMPRMCGLEFLRALAERSLRLPVILMTSIHNDSTAIQAMNLGASDYAIKPEEHDAIAVTLGPVIAEALAVHRRPPPVQLPDPGADDAADDSLIVGRSKLMLDVFKCIGRLTRVDETVLILGETGTGKDLVARAIHTNGARRDKPLVTVDCTLQDENLIHSELFGHERGAFTGAEKLRKGRFEHADGGTVFLDELGEMPLKSQAKLLRVLENREIMRLGSNDPIPVNVRVLAATRRDLRAMVRAGTFREDLLYRVEGMVIRLPPLRERLDDLELLARRFLRRLFDHEAPALAPEALAALRRYSWPGNVRQLQKVLCRAAGAARGAQILAADLDFGRAGPPAGSTDEAVRAALRQAAAWTWAEGKDQVMGHLKDGLEKEVLAHALTQTDLSEVKLAEKLGIARNTLRALLKKHGFTAPPETNDK